VESARPASFEDRDIALAILEQAISATPTARGGRYFRCDFRSTVASDRFDIAISESSSQVFVGTLDDQVVGIAITSVDHRQVGIVEELYVIPPARGVGVGEALLDSCVEWCRTVECVGVEMDVLPGDRNAKNMCERSGLKARALTMHLDLEEDPEL
jgi:GNAT superfamily N-acetyltransferase